MTTSFKHQYDYNYIIYYCVTIDLQYVVYTSNNCTRDGTGKDFLDPTGKFQNHRRLTGLRPARSTGFFTEGFSSLFNVFNENFSKEKGGMGEVLNLGL